MTSARIRITAPPGRLNDIRSSFAGARIERGYVILPSPMEPERPLNDHLVGLWRTLEPKRKFLRRMYQEGVRYVCECKLSGEKISLQPSGVEMLHLLQMELILEPRAERPRKLVVP
jgi:hypothetical protein